MLQDSSLSASGSEGNRCESEKRESMDPINTEHDGNWFQSDPMDREALKRLRRSRKLKPIKSEPSEPSTRSD